VRDLIKTLTVAGQAGVDVPIGTLRKHLPASGPILGREAVMKYAVVIERGPTSYGASVPDLPGCVAVASTRDEVERLIEEAIKAHLRGLRADGLPIPESQTLVTTVDV
jgi:predicted RNase H-like HicB family nuclease